MRLPLTIAVFVLLGASAQASPSPFPAPQAASAAGDSAIYADLAGATLEADYFRAPQPRYGASRIFPCRPHLQANDDTHQIAQSCD